MWKLIGRRSKDQVLWLVSDALPVAGAQWA